MALLVTSHGACVQSSEFHALAIVMRPGHQQQRRGVGVGGARGQQHVDVLGGVTEQAPLQHRTLLRMRSHLHVTSHHNTSQHTTAHHSTSQHTTAHHSTSQHITAHHNNTAQLNTSQQHSQVPHISSDPSRDGDGDAERAAS
jgi:hypothetical protein